MNQPPSPIACFYTCHLSQMDLNGISDVPLTSLYEEIAILRVFTRRVIELGKDLDSLPEAVTLLRSLCLSAARVQNLIRVQKVIRSQTEPNAGDIIGSTTTEVLRSIGYISPQEVLPSDTDPNHQYYKSLYDKAEREAAARLRAKAAQAAAPQP